MLVGKFQNNIFFFAERFSCTLNSFLVESIKLGCFQYGYAKSIWLTVIYTF